MSTSNLLDARFDDSDDEEDFNPQPADLSDDEGDNTAAQASKERVEDGPDTEAPAPRRKSVDQQNGDEEDEEDAEGEGEDITRDNLDDDDEDEEDDEEEEITVRAALPTQNMSELWN